MPRLFKAAFAILFLIIFGYGLLLLQYESLAKGSGKVVMDLSDWEYFESQTNHFKIKLPHEPSHAREEIELPHSPEIIRYQVYICETKEGATFMISVMKYPDALPLKASLELLESAVNEIISSNEGNRLEKMDQIKFHGFDAIDFGLNNDSVLIRGRTFLVGKSLYVLTLLEKKEVWTESLFQSFIQSFEYLDEFYFSDPRQGEGDDAGLEFEDGTSL